MSEKEPGVTVSELCAGFLENARPTLGKKEYENSLIIVRDFLLKLYGDDTVTDDFKPSCLKLVREQMVQSRRFCRNTVNRYIKHVVAIFGWGVEMELVPETIWRTLKVVKSLKIGYPGTFDHPERGEVPFDVVRKTLPFMPPMIRTMVMLQWLTGMRPSEVYDMRVGEIYQIPDGLWHYRLRHHKTGEHIGKKIIPLGKPEQELIAPYLEGKTPEEAVFSPRTAMAERNADKRECRKSKITPSQAARDAARAAKPKQYEEFYDANSYRRAIEHAIKKGNKAGVEIPHWFPYQLRHSAATVAEKTEGLDKAQALLGHTSANTTKRYAHAQLAITEELALNRKNPFESEE